MVACIWRIWAAAATPWAFGKQRMETGFTLENSHDINKVGNLSVNHDVALRAGQSQKILYDAASMRVTNLPDVNQWLTREYRAGWQPWSAAEAAAAI